MKIAILLLGIVFFLITPTASAHPGRTDSGGGHTCRTNCESWGFNYGEYHYHGGGSSGGSTGGSYTAPVQTNIAPIVEEQQVFPTSKPIIPLNTPPPTKSSSSPKYIETENDRKKLFKVVSVIDGDTIDVLIRGKVERLRLLAIDTPETKDPRTPVQCFGIEATNKMQSFVNGKFVKLVDDRTQGNRDKYQRLLRYVYDGKLFINAEMVKQGYAFSYKEYPTKYLEQFNNLERQAREKGLGLWNACNTTSPTKAVLKIPPSKPVQAVQQNIAPQGQQQTAPVYAGGDKDCSDFATHAEAQAFFKAAGTGDPHRLDRDGDGIACETLP